MILQEQIDNVECLGGGETTKFSIDISRKAFEILSAPYSDRPLAVVRELGCNAVDSHVAAGKADIPILIHLPNAFEPYLEIRDFGTGMSPETTKHIYTTYFKSTKTNTNTQVGCLGLGSKSPFCYSDSFTVKVNYDGICRQYLSYFDASGSPSFTQASEEPTTECNGVTIQIPVKKEDCEKFRQAAITAFKWFKVKPEIVGAKIDWSELERKIMLEGDGWRILERNANDHSWVSGNSYAVMGGVNYVIDRSKVNSDAQLVLNSLIVEVPMGELDFTPSREALSYDERTIANLNKRLLQVKAEIAAKATSQLAAVKYLDEAARVWNALPDFVRRSMGKFTWKGVAMDNIRAPFREFTKRSYRKSLRISNRDYVHVAELAKLEGISFTLAKKGDLWKVKEFLAASTTTDAVLVFEDSAKNELIKAGVNPAIFVCSSTLNFARTANSAQRQIDKEVVGIISSHYLRFDSINLRKAITDGAKYYAVKTDPNQATIKGKTASKEFLRQHVLNSNNNLCVFVAPTKEKLAIAAGLKPVDEYIDQKIKQLDSVEGQRYLALKEIASTLTDNSNTKKFIKIAETGKSNLSTHLTMGAELTALATKFSGLVRLATFLGVKAQAAAAKLPVLSDLEKLLFQHMNSYYNTSDKILSDYEKMFEKAEKNP